MSPMDVHFDEMTGLLYLEKQLDAERTREASMHLAACSTCRDLLRALERENAWLRDALAADDEPVPARLAKMPGQSSAGWGWVVVLGLAVGGVYTLWNGIIEPWAAQAQAAGFTQGNILTMLFFSGAFWKGWDAMPSLMEVLAMVTLGTAVVWVLRKHWRRFTAIAFVMGALACMLAAPRTTGAAEVRHGDPSYTLPAGQEVNTDLIVTANRTQIDGVVDGDLIVFSQDVAVNGHVKGDILAFGRELRVNGPVDGNVRGFEDTISISSAVGKNVMAFAQELTLNQKSSIGGTLTFFAGDADLEGNVGGDLLARGGTFEINGMLERGAKIRARRLKIGPLAVIKDQIRYVGPRQPEISPGARLGSPIAVAIRGLGPNRTSARYYWHQTLWWGAGFLFGLMLLLLAPGFFREVVRTSTKAGSAFGVGILFLIATPIAAALACFTIVGIGLGVAAILLYLIALYSAQVFIGSWIGEKLLGSGVGMGPMTGRLALGLAILRVLAILPFVGLLIDLAVIVWGLGALVMTFHRKMRSSVPAAA